MTIGAGNLLDKYKNSRLAIAEALIMNKLETYEQEFVSQLVAPVILEAARIRLEAAGELTKEKMSKSLLWKKHD